MNIKIIWIPGGDQNVVNRQVRATIEALVAGLKEDDSGTHLITFHSRRPGQSSRQLHDVLWLDFNMSATCPAARDHDNGLYAEYDFALTPLRSTREGEPRCESIHIRFCLRYNIWLDRFDDADVRQAAWWPVMAGDCGYVYGDKNFWQMWQSGRLPTIHANIRRHEALDHPGPRQMGLMRSFHGSSCISETPSRPVNHCGRAISRSWQDLRDARLGRNANAHLCAERRVLHARPEGDEIPLREQFWFDPCYGSTYGFLESLRACDSQTFQTYTPPTLGPGQDWVLVLGISDKITDSQTQIRN